jgi:glycosyltransferase involved in cell wall biosynthesis
MKPMKILMVGNYAPDGQESMKRFSSMLCEAYKSRDVEVRLVEPGVYLNRVSKIPQSLRKWVGYIDKFVIFPSVLKRKAKWADIVHICDHSNSSYIKALGGKPHLITCHDMLAIRSALGQIPDNVTGATGKILQKMILSGLRRAKWIACVSENTRQELAAVAPETFERSSVVYNGINYPYRPLEKGEAATLIAKTVSDKRLHDVIAQPYLFHIGGNQWYKNRLGVLKIYRQLRQLRQDLPTPLLAMAGQTFTPALNEYIEANGLKEFVVQVGKCSNETLEALYSAAEVMLFPSLAEGFGWPVVEAQTCGCRVVTSNFAPLTEIGGNAALYCEPKNVAEAAQQLNFLLNETADERRMRIESSIRNAEQFSSQAMTENYLNTYRDILGLSASIG